MWAENCILRTIKSIIIHYEEWLKETGGNKEKVRFYKNCSGVPLVNPEDVNTFIIDYLALPALHLLIGPFNSLYLILKELAPEVNKVAEKLGAVREDYF